MRVAMHLTFSASTKEPLAEMIGRLRQAFLDAGVGEPAIRFTFVDSALKKGAPVDRALKRYPEMQRFLTSRPLLSGGTESRMLSNSTTGEAAEYSTIQAITSGVPRTYAFLGVWMHFYVPLFGERLIGLPKMGDSLPGVIVTDNKWLTGRKRALWVYTVVEAQEGDKKLPPNPESVDAVIKACGKVTRKEQVPLPASSGGLSVRPETAEAVKAIVADYRARLREVVDLADLPHDLPPAAEIRLENVGVVAGPRKPALESAFKPMGYRCRGGSGQFHLTRRTPGNLTVELYLDVGTWSHSVTAIFFVRGAGFKASLIIPVAPGAGSQAQYPIGDAAQWQKIVENMAAMVRELDRSFVPEIEQAAGPTPAWYQPAS
jgi:hypothetical protein